MLHRDDQSRNLVTRSANACPAGPQGIGLFSSLLGLAMFAILLTLFFLPVSERPSIPSGLVGEWTTSSPRYADRGIKISATTLKISTGERDFSTYRIEKIAQHEISGTGTVLYSIEYSDRGQMQSLSFYYAELPEPEIRLKNQRHIVWNKESPRPHRR